MLYAGWALPPTFVILSDRRESKDLRTNFTTNVTVSAKILRLRAAPFAQNDRFGGALQLFDKLEFI